MNIVLASASPSRRSILNSAGVEPVIHPADVDEDALIAGLREAEPDEVVAALAEAKARKVAPDHPDDIVIGCDSMLLLDGELQGKPRTAAATVERWRRQRGRTAELITGHCVVGPGGACRVTVSRTSVVFADVSDADIEAYAATGEPWQCAGAFTLEALGGWFIDRIEGDPSNVIGLSLPVVRRAIYELGHDVSGFWNLTARPVAR
ncbi:Maf family protein [Corynebacterium meridianum]|uniref:Nucleoside triphosphate pyrophosphatase n=1 Tax=Corynebacterium meridianum TaxID=2765363 RepID=A0A934MB22_9CORY|nr:nucleoside triphosphate pyrophosphatase [Corynebacterium meridianum]MBI8989558.1 septum formation inhibitor Maf [Corynebacterium meridianum]MCK7677365.1 Maf-like protein [Corynebacterium meridianum]